MQRSIKKGNWQHAAFYDRYLKKHPDFILNDNYISLFTPFFFKTVLLCITVHQRLLIEKKTSFHLFWVFLNQNQIKIIHTGSNISTFSPRLLIQ